MGMGIEITAETFHSGGRLGRLARRARREGRAESEVCSGRAVPVVGVRVGWKADWKAG